MRYTLALAVVLAAVAAVCDSSAIDSSVIDSSVIDSSAIDSSAIDSSAIYSSAIDSSAIDSSAIDTSAVNNSTVLYEGADIASAPRNRLLHRAYFLRSAIANTIHIHDHTWRGSSVITVVRASEVGASQGASARITAGGVGRTTVTVRFQSLRGRGFHIMLEVWGR